MKRLTRFAKKTKQERTFRFLVLIGMSLLCLWYSGHAAGSSFLQQPGLRARGMGGAFSAVADDGTAGLWNPAGLDQLTQSEVTAIAGRLALGLDSDQLAYGFLSYVEPLPIGTVGLAGSQFASDLYKESELVLTFSQGLGDLYLGASLKGLFASLTENEYTIIDPLFRQHGLSHNEWSIDAGMLWRASDSVSVAFAASDLNQPSGTFASDTDLSLPITFRAGLHLWDKIAFDLDYRTRDINDEPDWNFHLGGEWWLSERLAIRAGANRDEIAAGTSVAIPYGANLVRIDYAAQYPMPFGDHIEDTWGSHLFAVSMRFGAKRAMPREWGAMDQSPLEAVGQERGVDITDAEADPSIRKMMRKIQAGNADKESYRHVAEYYAKQARLSDAATIYEAASQRYPEELSFLYGLGKTYEQLTHTTQGKQWLEKAAQTYQQILNQDEGYEDTTLRLMKIRIRQGRASEAIDHFGF